MRILRLERLCGSRFELCGEGTQNEVVSPNIQINILLKQESVFCCRRFLRQQGKVEREFLGEIYDRFTPPLAQYCIEFFGDT